MNENSEPEEGEACYYRDDDDDTINPDTALSYLDEKIKNVLGHFQKDFEGGVSAENLGEKFGGYGSFLPTYECFPSSLSHPKTPQRNSSTPRSTKNLSMEGAFQNLKAPPSAPLAARHGNASCPSGIIAAKHDSLLSFNHVAEKPALKDASFKRADILTDRRTLKVRIKVGSDTKIQMNSAIYSGLGLDDSPTSSWGNSPDESGGTMTASPGNTNESPTKILQVMTSYHVPGGVLISPLNDSLLCLLRNEKGRSCRDSTTIPLLKACRENSSGLIDESILGNGKELSEKKTEFLIGKSKKVLESKHGNRVKVGNDKKLLTRKMSESKITGGEELLADDLKHTALSNSVDVSDSVEATPRVCNLSAEANQDGSRGGLFSSDSSKKDSLESMSGGSRSSGRKKKRVSQHSLVEKVWEQSVVSSDKNTSLDLGDYGGSKCYQDTAHLKCKEDSKTKVGQEATFHVQNEINIPSELENTLFVGKKKSKGSKNTGPIADSMKESLRLVAGTTPKDTTSSSQSFSSGKSKMHKLKLQKDRARGNHTDALDANFKEKREKMDSSMSLVHNRPKGSGSMDFEREKNGSLDKSKEIFNDRTVDNQLLGVDAPGVVHLTDKTVASQMTASAAAAPVVIEENWVQCDRCHKWRLLPFDSRPEQLPEKWLCSMLNWLPGMNRCDISEDDTTKALNALYQIPIAENQNNPQNHASGTMSAHLQHLDQKNSSFISHVSSIQGKKKHDPKEVRKAGNSGLSLMSNSKKNQKQESMKIRSLKNMTQVPAESNLAKKPICQQNEKNPVAGGTKQAKMKNKRYSDLYVNEGSKKPKTEVVCTTDKHQSCNVDNRMVGLNTSTGLPTQVNGKSLQNYNKCSDSGDVKHDLKERSVVSVKKVVGQIEASSSDGMPLDMKRSDKMVFVKKRKWEDREDSQNGHKLYMKEESSESGFRNEKKPRVSKIEEKHSLRNDGDGTSNKKSMDHLVGSTEEVRSINRNQQLRKHKKKSSSHKLLDGLDYLRRDSDTGQILKEAMSSSSKGFWFS
ncbi:cysteine-tryptophan domain-containing zinc finger protein 7-like [Hibiscus syriacus]|uniref:cysteine-tryptophan domain-containing zinc finger protein 7-like n=1 Tax=Hibiscus syriacus TaxID=106335 RepID=UPI0019217ED5|nr:cysteine-tryptophan domain-containing zinc finger protein 7-like [Hibiscus syriacus]